MEIYLTGSREELRADNTPGAPKWPFQFNWFLGWTIWYLKHYKYIVEIIQFGGNVFDDISFFYLYFIEFVDILITEIKRWYMIKMWRRTEQSLKTSSFHLLVVDAPLDTREDIIIKCYFNHLIVLVSGLDSLRWFQFRYMYNAHVLIYFMKTERMGR